MTARVVSLGGFSWWSFHKIDDCWADAGDSFSQSFKHFHVKCGVHSVIKRYKLFMSHSFKVKKDNQHAFHFRLAHLDRFGAT